MLEDVLKWGVSVCLMECCLSTSCQSETEMLLLLLGIRRCFGKELRNRVFIAYTFIDRSLKGLFDVGFYVNVSRSRNFVVDVEAWGGFICNCSVRGGLVEHAKLLSVSGD